MALPKNLPPVTTWPPAAELRDRLEAEHPLLRALRHDVAAAAEGVSLAGIASRPDSRLSLEYIHLGDPLTPVPDASEDPLVASLTFPVPLRTARYRGMRREAQALRNAAAYELEDALVRLEAEIEEALFLRRDAERRRALYAEDLVSLVAQVFESTETAYRTGAATFFELVDAEHRRLEFELALVRAEHDRAVAEATLRALCGDAGGPESLNSPAPRR